MPYSIDIQNEELSLISSQINAKSGNLTALRKAFQEAKALYELRYSQIYLTLKAQDGEKTQGDLKAESVVGSHKERMDMIIAESSYRKVKEELAALRDSLDTAKEKSYNLREELRSLKGTDSQGNPRI